MAAVPEPRPWAVPEVSCIIIFLNEDRFLGEAIESVRAQTLTDWELILVDDGSTDGSGAIARGYAERDRRIRHVEHPENANRGMSASRNLGLRTARGRFVAFLDGDDIWLPHKLAHQLAVFERNPRAGMVCGATVYWHSWEVGVPPHPDREADITVPVGALEGRTTIEQDRLIEPPGLAHCLYPLGRGASPSTSGFMVRRELATSLAGFVDRFIALYEDQTFKMKVYLHAPVFVSSEVYDRYRQHAASAIMASRGSDRRDRARLEFLTWLQAYLAHRDRSFPLLRLKVQRALIRYRFPRLRALWVRLKRRQVAAARKGRSA